MKMLKLLAASILLLPSVALADAVWGNAFLVGAPPASVAVDGTNDHWARFTIWKTMTVSAAQIRLKDAAASSLTLSLQKDNGNGFPDGKPLATGTIASPKDGWNRATLSGVELKEGEVYFLVIDKTTEGSVGWMTVNVGKAGVQPTGIIDPMWSHGSGASVTPRTTAMFFLEGKDGNFGQPYVSKFNSKLLGGRNIPAQRFTFRPPPTGEATVASITLALNVAKTDTEEYTLALLDDKDTIIEAIKIPGDQVEAGPPKNYTFTMSGSTRLEEGKTYSLAFYCPSAAVEGAWVSDMTDAGEQEAEKATWQGIEGYAFKYSDSGLNAASEPELNRDMVFSFDLQ